MPLYTILAPFSELFFIVRNNESEISIAFPFSSTTELGLQINILRIKSISFPSTSFFPIFFIPLGHLFRIE